MKKAILIVVTVLAAQAAPVAHAGERQWNVLFTAGPEANSIQIELSADGRNYEIDSLVPLEVAGDVCGHPDGEPNKLICVATEISGFEVNAGGGDDEVSISPAVPVPVTLRGGPGDDRLAGGAGDDKLVGGVGADVLLGRGGDDSLFGGPDRDRLLGGPGDDLLRGGPGPDLLNGGGGEDRIRGDAGHDVVAQHPRKS
ncbi:MAG TPA: hypothetical protein VFN82_04075 [Solirubrobacterales bacterium]|jgi:hypothetical protein|nr:hypothetical protein [Solirubrobacterales bacterium]